MLRIKKQSETFTFTERDLRRDEPRSYWGEPKCRAWRCAKLQMHAKKQLGIGGPKISDAYISNNG